MNMTLSVLTRLEMLVESGKPIDVTDIEDAKRWLKHAITDEYAPQVGGRARIVGRVTPWGTETKKSDIGIVMGIAYGDYEINFGDRGTYIVDPFHVARV
jgi:uncharacterized lipoprotein YddW (UPF0748 family)